MLIFGIAGGVCVLLFLAAAMTGIEGNEYRYLNEKPRRFRWGFDFCGKAAGRD